MPSKTHQMLIGLISRKMRERGYLPVAYDGKGYELNGQEVRLPPKIKRHRPDVIGINLSTKTLCVGEAKTAGDLSSARTREQFLDYSDIIGKTSGRRAELIIGISKTAEPALLCLLASLRLDRHTNVCCIYLPEELVENDS